MNRKQSSFNGKRWLLFCEVAGRAGERHRVAWGTFRQSNTTAATFIKDAKVYRLDAEDRFVEVMPMTAYTVT